MKKKKIDIHIFDDNPICVCPPDYFYLVCCDCGLRHLVIVEKYKKGVRIGFAVDKHATKDIREVEKLRKKLKKESKEDL